MIPEIGLLTVTSIDWPTFRATMDKALNLRPDIDINRLPVDLSDDAKYLLNIAAFFGWPIDSPLSTLRNLSPLFTNYLSYSFFIVCDYKTWEEFNPINLTMIKQELSDYFLLIVTGTLTDWFQTITDNLKCDWDYTHETRVLFCKLMIAFESRGLNFLFEKYNKRVQQDFTFLLESK